MRVLRILFFALLVCFCFALSVNTQNRQSAALLILNKGEATMSIVDPVSLKVLAKVPTGDGPHEVITSADGKTAYVANYGAQTPGNSLSVIDLATRKETKRVDLGGLLRPHGIVEADGKIYFTSELSRTVARYNPAVEKVDWIMGIGQNLPHMLVMTPNKKRIYTANIFSDSVTAINLGASPVESLTHVAVGKKPEAIDISPDGSELWVGHNDDGGISVIDVATNKVKETFKVAQMPIRVKFTPDGSRVLISDPKAAEFIVVDAKTRKEIKRVKAEGTPVGILIEPNGKRAFIARMEAGNVGVFDLEKLEFVATIEPGKGPDGMAWAVGF